MARTATIHILTGDYDARLDALGEAIDRARADADRGTPSTNTLAEGDPVAQLEADYAALYAEAMEHATTVRLEAVGRRDWRRLREKHPPRTEGHDEDVRGDRRAGVNTETVEDDLVRASLVDPTFESVAAFEEWADRFSMGEWQTLVIKAWELANGARFNPKAPPSSPTLSDF